VTAAVLLLSALVETGLDRVAAGHDEELRGKRLGLLCHAASVTRDGRHAIDVFRARGLDVRRVFAPEHGLRGSLAAGEEVRDGRDATSGLPIVSLYGAKTHPSSEDLRDVDVFVVDLQDAGVRFYTYASTMLLAVEAALENGRTVVILDRPNPLGGERVEGPVSDPPEHVPRSLVNRTPGPLVHGLTLGEMARLVAAGPSGSAGRSHGETGLSVVPLRGWRRGMTWKDTGLPWVPPSPNLRSAEAALAYPGTCLLEATNLSEGRGTESPFLLLGAPWLAPDAVRNAIDAARWGFGLEVASFVPKASTPAPEPKYDGQVCRGFRVGVRDAGRFRPYAFGIALLATLRGQPGFAWREEGRVFDRLVGSRRPRAGLEAQRTVEEILASDERAIEAFRKERERALLY
jgi:uncharacterized protein YbbC (DUF1343 family)